MSDFLSPLLQWLNANPEWAGLVTFLISAAESVAVIGTIVPGSITMTAIGALAGASIIPLWSTITFAMIGAVFGDTISYWLGYYFKDRLRSSWPFRKNPEILLKGEAFVNRFGLMSVFIGRFVGPIRALVPLVAGMLGMKPWVFTIANIASAIGWAPLYMLPGILLGAASLELPPEIALHVIMALIFIILLISLCLWFTYKIFMLIRSRINEGLIKAWNGLAKRKYFRGLTVLLKHHNPAEQYGQLAFAIYLLIVSLLFTGLVMYVKTVGAGNIAINDIMYHLFRGIRSQKFDHVMLYITLLGQSSILIPCMMVTTVYLFCIKRVRAALHFAALGILTAACIKVLKPLIHSVRPWGIVTSPETFSMPSGHATLSAVVYMGFAILIAINCRKKYRKFIYASFLFLVFIIGISRLYLGAHWFTDIVAGWLLSAAILMVVILSFNREREKPLQLRPILLYSLLSFSLIYGYFAYTKTPILTKFYTKLEWPTSEIPAANWWQGEDSIPDMQVSLFGFPSQVINIEWAGNIEQIRETLINMGWTVPPARDWISTLHRMSDVNSTEYLPMVSPQYLDTRPELILAKREGTNKKLLVLRLWNSYRIFEKTNTPLWVGTIGVVPRTYSFIFRKYKDIETDPAAMFKAKPLMTDWQSKVITKTIAHNKKSSEQKILLIQPAN